MAAPGATTTSVAPVATTATSPRRLGGISLSRTVSTPRHFEERAVGVEQSTVRGVGEGRRRRRAERWWFAFFSGACSGRAPPWQSIAMPTHP
jgi:hypothetical protein